MKRALSSPDLRALVRGWQFLAGGHLEQLHRPTPSRLHFKLRAPGRGTQRLLVDLAGWAHLTSEPPADRSQGGFITALRGRIKGARLIAISQLHGDRLLALDLTRGGESYRLVIELFHRGNALLLQDEVIVLTLRRQSFRHRTLAPGVAYQPPPAPFNPFTTTPAEFVAALANSRRPLVSALAVDWNLGGDLAETLATGSDPAQAAATVPSEVAERLATRANELLAGELAPALWHRNDELVTVSPYPLEGFERGAVHDTFDEAIAAFLAAQPKTEVSEPQSRRHEQQSQAIAAHDERGAALRRRGELVFAHLAELGELLDLHNRGGPLPTGVTYDAQRRELNFELDGESIALAVEIPPEATASAYFDQAKRREAKAQRGREVREQQARRQPEKRPPRAPTAKPEWFERYRWFIASTGEIAVAGRDATSNDRVVKRYLKQQDYYAHADIHGASSVVVKHLEEPPSDAAMEEACRFSLAFSRAWPLGIAGGHAFWVTAEQVSKTPNPGEFLPKGAFVIRGRRQWHRNLPLEMAVGVIDYQDHPKVMSGPPSAMAAHATAYAVFKPGYTDRNRVLAALARVLEVERESLAGKLPPGDVELVRAEGLTLELDTDKEQN